jgi:hypothetical protein
MSAIYLFCEWTKCNENIGGGIVDFENRRLFGRETSDTIRATTSIRNSINYE